VDTLATLIKLQKVKVDEQRLLLADLEDIQGRVLASIAELERLKLREQEVAEQNEEAQSTFGAFIKQAIKRGRELERDRQIAEAAVNAARDEMLVLFEEQKRYEIAEAQREAAREKEEKRRETITFDEISSVRFTRQKE
jgi:hypothetical protein